MPRRSRGVYPPDWAAISQRVRVDAGWCCVRCGVPHGPVPNVLTVHHLDMDPSHNRWWNLIALCQRCHLSVQGRVDLRRPWVLEHSTWFQPYVAGWYAWRYLGLDLSRADVLARLPELLAVERAVMGLGIAIVTGVPSAKEAASG